jgi:hypothetical protein
LIKSLATSPWLACSLAAMPLKLPFFDQSGKSLFDQKCATLAAD